MATKRSYSQEEKPNKEIVIEVKKEQTAKKTKEESCWYLDIVKEEPKCEQLFTWE
jgi:hypothetical protein